ncbi:MAG: MmcQ/YjbR family DNA-binding protein [Planctomycetes bacterium]|nr:MmcQ/YjbR family DNA-binding protein [Planctomycetota bacterium]
MSRAPRKAGPKRASAPRPRSAATLRAEHARAPRRPTPDAVLARLCKLALALPGASETVTFGHPAFRVAKKLFVVLEEYRGELCLVFKAELPRQQELVLSPRFFVAPYVGKHGWVSLRVHAAPLDWKEIAELVRESWRLVAPRRLTAELAPPAPADRAAARRPSTRP